ncbi:MAG: hypothetical protein Q8L79_00450 [Methylobacter sp.]|uniref:hypothetical protein n=1 Tax=Methylobacter sp. TaxID=2051955 RepID=UPI00272F7560|nr:hypothetical protein [Methylobacter sp.]MDP1663570.1 hypothetical protein [Methylobacter sp.]
MINEVDILEIEKLFTDMQPDALGNKPVRDGIVNLKTYISAPYRVLWILKEPNDEKDEGGWDLREFLSNGNFKGYRQWKRTFSLPLRVSYGMLNGFTEWESLPKVDKIENRVLESIAYINLKKIPGGARANGSMIADAYKKSKHLILEQIRVFKPHVIICCGFNMYLLNADLGITDENIKKDIEHAHYTKHDSIVFIDTYHPAQISIKHQVHYEAVIAACKKGFNLA